MDKKLLALYSDYLLSSFGATTATGLSSLLDGQISHDQVTRFLSQAEYTSKELWHQVKTVVRTIEREDGLVWIDRLRNHAGVPVAEYALELETRFYEGPSPRLTVPEKIENFRTQRGYKYSGEMRTAFGNDFALGTPMAYTRFPRYSLGSSDEIIRILNAFELDLWNNVGLPDQGHDGLTIKDFG